MDTLKKEHIPRTPTERLLLEILISIKEIQKEIVNIKKDTDTKVVNKTPIKQTKKVGDKYCSHY